jgi:hypothetical protein
MGIAISGIMFDGPYSLNDLDIPKGAAVYSVLYKQADNWHVVYVGETSDLNEKSINLHHKRGCWIERAGSELNLYIAIYPMPDSIQRQRQRIQAKIKFENEPPCND